MDKLLAPGLGRSRQVDAIYASKMPVLSREIQAASSWARED